MHVAGSSTLNICTFRLNFATRDHAKKGGFSGTFNRFAENSVRNCPRRICDVMPGGFHGIRVISYVVGHLTNKPIFIKIINLKLLIIPHNHLSPIISTKFQDVA